MVELKGILPVPETASIVVGITTAVLGFFGGAIRERHSFEARYTKRVEGRLDKLEKEVEECRKRDGHLAVMGLSLKMVVPEMYRKDPRNPVLQHVVNALSALPPEVESFAELLAKLDQIP